MNQPTDSTPTNGTLPVRQKCTPAELELCACWIDEHGDPADWPQAVRLAYANTVACARAAGTL